MERQVKSKERVAKHGEVFTAAREVNAMLDMVKQETERIDSRFLEPACGDGNFLAEILRRKLAVVKKRYGRSSADYEKFSVLAIMSIYGVDIMEDNAKACRARLFDIWNDAYTAECKKDCTEACRKAARFIFKRNILYGDALTMMLNNTEPIIFSEWSFITGNLVKRRDFRFDVLLKENKDDGMYEMQYGLFQSDNGATAYQYWEEDPKTHEIIPKPIKDYPPMDYRRLCDVK